MLATLRMEKEFGQFVIVVQGGGWEGSKKWVGTALK